MDLQPPAKRPRTEDHPRQGTEQTSDTSFPSFHRCDSNPKLWFEDGSIVVVCGITGFRVHKGILALNSTVFKDMLAVGDGNLDCNETFEDCAVVRLQDDAQDILWLLEALYYPRKCVRKGDVIDFEVLVSLFETTSKYALDELRKEFVEDMKVMLPTDLDSYCSEESLSIVPNNFDPAIAVQLGIKYNIPAILPLACYEAAFISVAELFNGPRKTKSKGTPMILDREAERRCLLFRDKLTSIVAQVLDVADLSDNPWTNSETGIECDECGGIEDSERQVIERTYRSLELDVFRDFWSKSVNSRSMDTLKKLRGSLSPCCDPRLRSFDQEVGRKIWDRLPEACGYADWDAVVEAQAKSSNV